MADGSPSGIPLLSLERAPDDPTILVRAAVEPLDPVVTMLDTGGKVTEFVDAAVPGRGRGPRKGAGHGVGGCQVTGSEVEGQTLVVGDARLPVPRLLVRDEMDGYEGLVGMDLLRGTVLTVTADPTRPVIWQVPRGLLQA